MKATQEVSVRTGAAHDAPTTLPDVLDLQSRTHPSAVVVESGSRRYTFGQLNYASKRMAATLSRLGVGADDRVGLFVEPSWDLMVGAWGTLRAGAAYVPLSPEYPEERVRYMVEDSRARVIVTQEHLRERLAAMAPPGTTMVTLADTSGVAAAEVPRPRPDSLAYVIYTSGSTGKPKGVMIEHRSIVSQMRWMQYFGGLNADMTVLQKTPMSFDAAQWEILAPATGARVVLGAPGIYRDPEALVDVIKKHEVTTLQCVPTLLQALLDTEGFETCTSLRQVFAGGEMLSRRLAQTFTARFPATALVNLYGPTECTINATAYRVDADKIGDDDGSVPIGVPVDNTQCYILDEDLAPVPIGTTGELYIGGVQLARGYVDRPDLTAERFIMSPFVPTERLYRTGDLAYWNPDGTMTCVGRMDHQIKLRGYRIELDEIALAVEKHSWVRRAAAVAVTDERTDQANLVVCLELNPQEAPLMDQGNHGAHHQSKSSKLQVKAQLSNPGLRAADSGGRPPVPLPGKQETRRQRETVFSRKTYRFYDGGAVTRADLLELLAPRPVPAPVSDPEPLTPPRLGELLRWFGQFHSGERLLPKYSYASPGALYATQLYVETDGTDGVDAGTYYYHPLDHTLVRVADATSGAALRVHFIGKKQAIEPVYANNIQEVLEIETGHMIGVFEEVLPAYGRGIRPAAFTPVVKDRLGVADEDYYLGTFEIHPHDGTPQADRTEIYVQAHPGRMDDLPAGQYRYADGELTRVSDDLVQPRHVIAINQAVYDRASFGITAVSRETEEWLTYIGLGTKLHHLQRNGLSLGFMSSGYSSKSGNPLPAAVRMDEVLASQGIASGPSYFFVGGRVTEGQARSEGMDEDTVHMKGPAELIKDELALVLPDYMIPNRVLVLDALPLSPNGKVDLTTLAASPDVRTAQVSRYVAPSTPHEKWLADAWGTVLKYDEVSVEDEFFASGGNSLTAVALINRINREFDAALPLQAIFEHPKLVDLAARIGADDAGHSSRLVRLQDTGAERPVFCWPGLGGYPMNLRPLAQEVDVDRPFYGIQAYGINSGEAPYSTVREMAAADVAEIRRVQPEGPYMLWGYSFGARVAFETAWQLEQLGERVEQVLLICPGNPHVDTPGTTRRARSATYDDLAYLTILYSVFSGTITGPDVEECRAEAHDEETFVAFVARRFPALEVDQIRRITAIVQETYEFEYTFSELAERTLNAPVTILKAQGDDYSFIENSDGFCATPPTTVTLDGDHYSVLKPRGVAELTAAIRARLAN
ncbi:amino acid adenylation domain-containing protein [Streptomyces sp. NPDC087425]|uniref:non-ribosomal peptide synthetase family protein n=1 Tax=Streptomyces sp. NPDC087425 TaxID=3365787 RepID=UPI003800F2E6